MEKEVFASLRQAARSAAPLAFCVLASACEQPRGLAAPKPDRFAEQLIEDKIGTTALSLTPKPELTAPPEVQDLLYTISFIGVSSASTRPDCVAIVGSCSDDESVWCSRAGDAIGAWIEFDVPPGAQIDEIVFEPGFDRTPEERATAFELLREHDVLGRSVLNGDQASLATELPGGRYWIRITEMAAPSAERVCGWLHVRGLFLNPLAKRWVDPVAGVGRIDSALVERHRRARVAFRSEEELLTRMPALPDLQPGEWVVYDWAERIPPFVRAGLDLLELRCPLGATTRERSQRALERLDEVRRSTDYDEATYQATGHGAVSAGEGETRLREEVLTLREAIEGVFVNLRGVEEGYFDCGTVHVDGELSVTDGDTEKFFDLTSAIDRW